MEGLEKPERRRQLVVDPTLQRRIIEDIVRVPLVAFVICVLVLAVVFGSLYAEAQAEGVELPSLMPCVIAVLVMVVVATFALLSQAVRFSNRVAGPQFNIHRVVERATAGERGLQVRLRERDYLGQTAADVNTLLVVLEQSSAGAAPAPAAFEAAVAD